MPMTPPDFYSLNHVISWLQHLYEKQKKGALDPTFEVTNYLAFEAMPVFEQVIQSEAALCFYAAKLFAVELTTITLLKKRLVTREHCWEITFEIAGQLQVFFIKQAWEGAIKEAIGLEFSNLLTDTPIRYLGSHDMIITEKIFEPLPADTLHELRESEAYIFAYGAWETFTNLLHLTDRKITNVRWNGERLANIDFGLVFYKGKAVFDSRFTLHQKTEERKQGQLYALKHILKRFQQHHAKLEALLLNLDVHFCRNIPCARTPREPLRIILTALKEIPADIMASLVSEQQVIEKKTFIAPTILEKDTDSLLKSLLSIEGMLYAAIISDDGIVIDDIESVQYQEKEELKQKILHNMLGNAILNQYLLDLMTKGRSNCILKTVGNFKKSESIQIDLTQMRLLVLWDNEKNIMAFSLLELQASVAHVKVAMRKAIEKFSL